MAGTATLQPEAPLGRGPRPRDHRALVAILAVPRVTARL